MRVLCLLMLMVWPLPGSTILPGSYIEVYDAVSGAFSIQADDGFFIAGRLTPNTVVAGDPDAEGFVNSNLIATGLDVAVSAVSSPWVAGEGFGVDGDGIFLEVYGSTFPMVHVSAPFTFLGYLQGSGDVGNPNPDYYEFTGHGTVYLTIGSGDNDFVETARYEFEATPVPEPSTWALLLAGLLALRRGRSARILN